MQPIAHVKEIWRYPVKSMGGESIEQAGLTPIGINGDRLWTVVDADGEIKSARQWPKLIEMTASYKSQAVINEKTYTDDVPDVAINIPEHPSISSRSAETNEVLGRFLDKDCRLEPLRPPSDTDFYIPPKERNLDNLAKELDHLEGEGEFDFSQTPDEVFEILGRYMTPPGTFFDSLPLHMVSTQSLSYLAQHSEADVNRARFRPNILLDFVDESFDKPEFELLDKRIRIGDVIILIRGKTIRCSIPSRPQPLLGLGPDRKMTRAMVDLFERHVGVYANIETGGVIKVGDPIYIETE